MELGKNLGQVLVREIREESGLDVIVIFLAALTEKLLGYMKTISSNTDKTGRSNRNFKGTS